MIELIEGNDFCCDYVKRSGFPGHNIYKVITIILGNILVRKSENFEATAGIGVISRALNWLMEKSFKDSPFGWQLLAVATKK